MKRTEEQDVTGSDIDRLEEAVAALLKRPVDEQFDLDAIWASVERRIVPGSDGIDPSGQTGK